MIDAIFLSFFNMDSNLRRIECYRPHNTKRICELQNLRYNILLQIGIRVADEKRNDRKGREPLDC